MKLFLLLILVVTSLYSLEYREIVSAEFNFDQYVSQGKNPEENAQLMQSVMTAVEKEMGNYMIALQGKIVNETEDIVVNNHKKWKVYREDTARLMARFRPYGMAKDEAYVRNLIKLTIERVKQLKEIDELQK